MTGAEWSELLTLRFVLFVQALLALILFGGLVGHFWARAGRAWHLLSIGLLTVGLYVLIGQVKAYNYAVPVDAVTYLGVLGYAVVIGALLRIRHKERAPLRRR